MTSSEEDPRLLVLQEAEENMKTELALFDSNLKSIMAGRAHPDILYPIIVKLHDGKKVKIKELATVISSETKLLTLVVWQLQHVNAVVKALKECNYKFNPQVDRYVIRITLPQLTEETRKTLNKQAKQYTEDCKVALRNILEKCSDDLKTLLKENKITEDDVNKVHKQLEKMTVDSERKLEEKSNDLSAD